MQYKGETRYKGNTVKDFSSYKETADSYPRLLSEEERLGFKQKPFDWSKGHPNFFGNIYQLLNGIQAMELEPGSTIVEVGSGAGWATEILACLKYKVICIEPSDVMIEAAKQRVTDYLQSHAMSELIPSIRYICNTLEEEELEENSADAVLFFESFHHIIDEDVALDKIRNFLKPDGVLCILGDANWIPGYQEQEEFWEDEMRRFGTLESPFTHDYLTALLDHHQFYSICRHHCVNAMIPVDQEEEPVRNFTGDLDARYVNLFTARNGKDKKLVEQNHTASTEEPPGSTKYSAPEKNSQTVLSLANWIKNNSPDVLWPFLSRIWHKFIKRRT